GGTKELYWKMLRDMADGVTLEISQVAMTVGERVAMSSVSPSRAEARQNGFIDKSHDLSVIAEHWLHDATQRVRVLALAVYTTPDHEKVPVVGDSGYAAMLLGAKGLQLSGYASEHDLKIAEKIAYVLSGGRIKEGTLVDEQTILDLEREAFLSLIGEPKTQQRMQHMLVKGKPLRN